MTRFPAFILLAFVWAACDTGGSGSVTPPSDAGADTAASLPDGDASGQAEAGPEQDAAADTPDLSPEAGVDPGASAGDIVDASESGADSGAPGDGGDVEGGGSGYDTFLSDCEELGISDAWEGTWAGTIDFMVEGMSGPNGEDSGTFDVSGVMSFGIECIDSKLVVHGDMEGNAEVPGYEDSPFTLTLQGYYDPSTTRITAQLVEGMTSTLGGIIEIYFEGSIEGDLKEDRSLAGTWEGHATGTNTPLLVVDATGGGDWIATEAARER